MMIASPNGAPPGADAFQPFPTRAGVTQLRGHERLAVEANLAFAQRNFWLGRQVAHGENPWIDLFIMQLRRSFA